MTKRVLPGSGARDRGPVSGYQAGIKKPAKKPNAASFLKKTKNEPKPVGHNSDNITDKTPARGHMYGAYGGYPGVPYRKARRLASGLLRDEIRDIRPDINAAERQYQRSVGDISHVFGESGDYIGYQNGLIAGQTAGAASQSQQLAQQLSAQLAGNNQAAQSGSNAELERLGISGAAMPGYFAADQANAQNVAAQTGANAQSNIAAMGQGAAQVGNLLLGANAGSRAQSMGLAANMRDETVSKVRDAIRQIKGSRKDLTLQLLQQLAESGWGQYMDQTQLDLSRRAMSQGRASSGTSSAGYGSSGSGSSSSSSGNTYYGDKVEGLIGALSGGTPAKPKKGKKKGFVTSDRPQHMAHIPNPNAYNNGPPIPPGFIT